MPDIFAEALALPGLWILIVAAFLAGTVRGFSGFGTAMIFLPLAALVVEPVWAILALIGMDILGPIPLIRRVSRDASWPDLSLILGFSALFVPFGVFLLLIISPEIYRYAVSFIALGLVACLVFGLRYSGRPGKPLLAVTGAIAGVSGGLAGVPGPPVILLYMASKLPVAQVRANTFMFLFCFEFIFLTVLAVNGQFTWFPLVLGVVLAIPNGIGNLVGQAIFDPSRAGLYRNVAYGVVIASAVIGLPLWDG